MPARARQAGLPIASETTDESIDVPTARSLRAVATILAGETALSFAFPDDRSSPSS